MSDAKLHVTYNDIHKLIFDISPKIAAEFNPDLLVAIGGGGFFPARVLRTFLRQATGKMGMQIQAIGLSLYEPIPGTTVEQLGQEVIRTQWMSNPGKIILGKRILVVDEVDDSRKTLHYAISELQKDVETELVLHPETERDRLREATKFAIFVVHNKKKLKMAQLPVGTLYYSGQETKGDAWIDYPWEVSDIDEHDRLAALDKQRGEGSL